MRREGGWGGVGTDYLFLLKVSAQANFTHFCIIFGGCFMDNIYMSLH